MTWGEKFTAHVLRSLPTLFNLLAVFSEIFFTYHFLINYFTVFHILILEFLKCSELLLTNDHSNKDESSIGAV